MIGLDLSAAFHTVDHEVLLQRLQSEFGVTAIPLTWIHSYLEGRTQYLKFGQHQSPSFRLHVGDPSCLFSVHCCLQYTVAQWLMLLRLCEPCRQTSPLC